MTKNSRCDFVFALIEWNIGVSINLIHSSTHIQNNNNNNIALQTLLRLEISNFFFYKIVIKSYQNLYIYFYSRVSNQKFGFQAAIFKICSEYLENSQQEILASYFLNILQ